MFIEEKLADKLKLNPENIKYFCEAANHQLLLRRYLWLMISLPHYFLWPRSSGVTKGVQVVWTPPLCYFIE